MSLLLAVFYDYIYFPPQGEEGLGNAFPTGEEVQGNLSWSQPSPCPPTYSTPTLDPPTPSPSPPPRSNVAG